MLIIGLNIIMVMVCSCQSLSSKQQSPAAIYALHLMAHQPEQLNKLLEAIENGHQAVIKIDKSRAVPLKIVFDGKFARTDSNQNEIRLILNQDIYISLSKKATMISTDGRKWENIQDLQALKKMFDFQRGTIKFSLAQQPGQSVSLVTILETHQF